MFMEKVNNQNITSPNPSFDLFDKAQSHSERSRGGEKEGYTAVIPPLAKGRLGGVIDLSIIIVSYKSKDHLAVLLPSIFGSKGLEFVGAGLARPLADDFRAAEARPYTAEIFIVDNDSRDGTIEWLEESFFRGREKSSPLQIVKNINNGFSAGNNLGIKNSSGKYILLLNPDTKVEPETFEVMLDFMESRPDVGISGCKLIKADGKLDLACRRRFPNPWNSFKRLFLRDNQNYNYTDIDENQSMEVDSVVGAFLLIRRVGYIGESENQIAGTSDFRLPTSDYLDEDFFMYGEDLDLCWRCKQAGFKVWYYPKTIVTHYKGESSRKEPFVMLKAFHNSMWIFYKKHYYKKYPFFLNWLVFCGIYFRFGALVFINLFKADPRVSR